MKPFSRMTGLPALAIMLASSSVLAQQPQQRPQTLEQVTEQSAADRIEERSQAQGDPAGADPRAASKPVETLGLTEVALDDALKDKFAAAYADILKIQAEYTERLEGISDQTQAMALQKEAQQEMQQALEANELTVEEYNHIIELASNSEPLMRELEQKIAEESS